MANIEFDKSGIPVKVNGKPVMKSYQNAYRKAMSTSYFTKFEGGRALLVRGNFLTPLESSIYKWIMDWQWKYEEAFNASIYPVSKVTETPVTTFDCMRYLFRVLNPGVYMEILD